MVQTKAKVTFTTSATIALTGMPGGREAARLDGAVRQYQSHRAQNQQGLCRKTPTPPTIVIEGAFKSNQHLVPL